MEPGSGRRIILIECEYFPELLSFAQAAKVRGFYIAAVYPTARRIGVEFVDEACSPDDPVWESESEVFAVIPSETGFSESSERFMNGAHESPDAKPVFLLTSHLEELIGNFGNINIIERRKRAVRETAQYFNFTPRFKR